MAVGLLAGEILIRLFPPAVVWRLQQQVRYPQGSEEYRFRNGFYRIAGDGIGCMHNPLHPDFNECGVYGRDIPLQKPEGSFRILFLGDSVTDPVSNCRPPYGYTFVAVDRLNAEKRSLRIEGLNAGVGGYNTEQESAYLEKYGFRMAPDLIVLGYVNNDNAAMETWRREGDALVGDYYREERVPLFFRPGPSTEWLLLHSLLVRCLFIAGERLRLALGYRPATEHFLPEDTRHRQALERLQTLCRERNIPLVIVHFPFFGDFERYESSHAWRYHQLLADFTARHRIPYLDLLEVYRRHAGKILHEESDLITHSVASHPNRAGHRIAGEALAAFLAATGLVPPRREVPGNAEE